MFCFVRRRCSTTLQKQIWGSRLPFPRRLSVPAKHTTEPRLSVPAKHATEPEDQEVKVAVSDKNQNLRLFQSRRRRRGPWRMRALDGSVPALYEFYPSGLWDAIVQATYSINKLFKDSGLLEPTFRVVEECGGESYKLQYKVPGLGKEYVEVVVEDGVLKIRGQREEEDEEGWWYFGDINLVLPEDAKCDGIRAQMKDGVLTITIPRTREAEKDAKVVPVH